MALAVGLWGVAETARADCAGLDLPADLFPELPSALGLESSEDGAIHQVDYRGESAGLAVTTLGDLGVPLTQEIFAQLFQNSRMRLDAVVERDGLVPEGAQVLPEWPMGEMTMLAQARLWSFPDGFFANAAAGGYMADCVYFIDFHRNFPPGTATDAAMGITQNELFGILARLRPYIGGAARNPDDVADAADIEMVYFMRAVRDALVLPDGATLAWQSPDTGGSGTIRKAATQVDASGDVCIALETQTQSDLIRDEHLSNAVFDLCSEAGGPFQIEAGNGD